MEGRERRPSGPDPRGEGSSGTDRTEHQERKAPAVARAAERDPDPTGASNRSEDPEGVAPEPATAEAAREPRNTSRARPETVKAAEGAGTPRTRYEAREGSQRNRSYRHGPLPTTSKATPT